MVIRKKGCFIVKEVDSYVVFDIETYRVKS